MSRSDRDAEKDERIRELEHAILEFLGDMYEADLSGERLGWPVKLEELVSWKEPDERG